LLKNSSEEAPVSSPLVPVSSFGSSQGEEQNKKAITKADKVQAILKKIKQVWNLFMLFMNCFGFLICMIGCKCFTFNFTLWAYLIDYKHQYINFSPEKLIMECILYERF